MDELEDTDVFYDGLDIGTVPQIIGLMAGGAAGDWITNTFGIAAMEPELGSVDQHLNWLPRST